MRSLTMQMVEETKVRMDTFQLALEAFMQNQHNSSHHGSSSNSENPLNSRQSH